MSRVFGGFIEATIRADNAELAADTRLMMIKLLFRGDRRSGSAIGRSVTARLLRGPLSNNPEYPLQDAALVDLIRIKMGFPKEVFEPVVSPVLNGYAGFLRALPAAASRQQADPGTRFTQALQLVSRALDLRRGQILPRGAAPEIIGAQAHRWTYAVFVGALLNEERQAGHAADLLNRWVPPRVLEWLAAEPEPMAELLAFLAGEDSVRRGAISNLVLRAAGTAEADETGKHVANDPNPARTESTAGPAVETVDPDMEEPAATSSSILAANTPAAPPAAAEYLEPVDDSQPDDPLRFMTWLQRGLADGTLPFNVPGALVHFVPEGMLLISPRIFREFAIRCGEDGNGSASAGDPDIGKSIQRQFLSAGWHLRGDKGVNILSYQLMRGERAVAQLSGVVISKPERFIDPVPAVNPLLIRSPTKAGSA